MSLRHLLPAAVVLALPGYVPSAAPPPAGPDRQERLRSAKMPALGGPVMFDPPEADAVCSALEVFPPDNPWNTVIEDWPTHPDSKAIVASIGADKPLRYNPDMGF